MKKSREKVLVFEDTDSDFEIIRCALQGEGYQVVRARTPEEFRKHAPFDEFVLVLVDFFLGSAQQLEKVGIGLTRSVKEKNPSLPVVVASSLEPSRKDVADAFRAGAWDYLDKKDLFEDVSGNLKRVREASVDDDTRAEEQLPLPMAFLFRSFRRTLATPKQRLERMIELFEVTLKVVTYILLSAHRENLTSVLPDKVRAGLERPSLGHFTSVLNALPEAEGFVAPLSKVTVRPQFRQLCQELIAVRNEFIGHGVRQRDAVYERVLRENTDKMMELLHMLNHLRKWRLVKPNNTTLLDDGYSYDLLIFRGSNPEVPAERLQTTLGLTSDHVHLLDEEVKESLDLYPWCQYLTCEQVCLGEKLFLYRLCREGELWALDHVYGHALQTREGYQKVREVIDPATGKQEGAGARPAGRR
ncbi:MAG TPA: response regulator [Pyrinomonadaceae bacterium]|nr:response regulator [Pyrinomonadaceae bacterium]